MSYTTLLVTDLGVRFFDGHRARVGEFASQFDALARTAAPGVYTVTQGVWHQRAPSRLVDGRPTRLHPSPFSARGAFPKPAPPSPYDSLRLPDVSTLLTSPDGREIYESCSAAVLAWEDGGLVLVPDDRPRVASVAEAWVRAQVPHTFRPLRADHPALLLVNALTASIPAGSAFPPHVRDDLLRGFQRTERRP